MIDAKTVAELRAMTGAGMVECKKALEEVGGDLNKAVEVLRKNGAAKAAKKNDRSTAEGLIHAYVHSNEKLGALVELQCETDFVARTNDFKDLAHELAMQVAATDPAFVSPESIPAGEVEKARAMFMAELAEDKKPDDIKAKIVEGRLNKWFAEATLLKQPWLKDEEKTIEQLINEKIATIGEKIMVARFSRFQLSGVPRVEE
jgi:elongation factor Ts